MIAAIAFVCIVIVQAYLCWKLANLGWRLSRCAIRRWRRWRRWRRVRSRRDFSGEFGWMFRLTHELCQDRARHAWGQVLARERATADAERRRRMRGGYDVAGLP